MQENVNARSIKVCTDIGRQIFREGVIIEKDGLKYVFIDGADEPLIGVPRQNVLYHLEKSKPILVSALRMLHAKSKHLFVKYSEMVPEAKAIHDAFDKLINWELEVNIPLREIWAYLRNFGCLIMHEDFPYRWRMKALIQELAKDERLKFNKSDLYWIKKQADWKFGKDG